jgi:arginine-tRNA-protein transferase
MAMVEDTTIHTNLIEYRIPSGEFDVPGRLIGTALTDTLDDGLSMVYSFYDPSETARSLGTFMVLDHIERARTLGLPYVYLGYWVDHSRKMAYKTRFSPLEALTHEGWRRMAASA